MSWKKIIEIDQEIKRHQEAICKLTMEKSIIMRKTIERENKERAERLQKNEEM